MTPNGPWLLASTVGLAASLLLAIATWVASQPLRDVSIVDAAWSALVLVPALVVAMLVPQGGARTGPVLLVAGAWALRLAAYIVLRRRGDGEDARYQAMRRHNEPYFRWKSLYLVFGLQAALAWIVSLPLMAAVSSPRPWGALDAIGLALASYGLVYEAVADAQLARFKANPAERGRVMDRGLWRYSRHPNYFGECCMWWGLWLVAASAGAWWTIPSPLLMTLLLLRVSGVALLESTIGQRRPDYADYARRTNAFIPGFPRA